MIEQAPASGKAVQCRLPDVPGARQGAAALGRQASLPAAKAGRPTRRRLDE
jgi:hypothetical protein